MLHFLLCLQVQVQFTEFEFHTIQCDKEFCVLFPAWATFVKIATNDLENKIALDVNGYSP